MHSFRHSLTALVAGLGLMYCFDPERGRIRRALLADRGRRLSRRFRHFSKVQFKRVKNRFRGYTANIQYQLSSAPVGDDQLNAQVRSRLGRLVGHPGAIHTQVRDGNLRLHGPILAEELNTLMANLRTLNGLRSIDSRLRVREGPGREPGLQGHPRSRRFTQKRVSPFAVAGGATLCGLMAENRAVRAGAFSAATLFLAAGAYQRWSRNRRIQGSEEARETRLPLDYRPFVDAADEAASLKRSLKG